MRLLRQVKRSPPPQQKKHRRRRRRRQSRQATDSFRSTFDLPFVQSCSMIIVSSTLSFIPPAFYMLRVSLKASFS
jgi:hypothetical protein